MRGAPALPFRRSAIGHKKKASLRIPREAVRIALREHKERQNACAFPLHSAALVETSHISLGDRFAAQIVYATGRNAPAPKASGWPRAKPEPRSDRKGPHPPICRLPSTDSFLSFQFFGLKIFFIPCGYYSNFFSCRCGEIRSSPRCRGCWICLTKRRRSISCQDDSAMRLHVSR